MATCKDCIHDKACTSIFRYYGGNPDCDLQGVEKMCKCFEDQSRFVRLPCKIGDTVYALYSIAEYKTRYGSRRRQNTQIYTNYHLQWAIREKAVEIREKRCTKGDISLIGRLTFTTREEAERVIANDNNESD